MKVHRYQITIYESVLNFTHGMGRTQTRLYIPNQGVLGFRDGEENVDFFADEPEAIAEAEEWLKGNYSNVEGGVDYQGEVELPDEAIAKVVETGRTLNQTKTRFNESAKSLVGLLGD